MAVRSPLTSTFKFCQLLVLSFSARPAVQGFYRAAAGIWHFALSTLYQTQFFDDYFLVAAKAEKTHVDLIQSDSLPFWAGRLPQKKILDPLLALEAQIDLSDCCLGLVKISNTLPGNKLERLIDDILASSSVFGIPPSWCEALSVAIFSNFPKCKFQLFKVFEVIFSVCRRSSSLQWS